MENNQFLPSVSIIVPVYNAEKTVKACVESLLVQTYPAENLEILIVDNKSKDSTLEVLRPYADAGKIKLLSETTILNAYGARNKGISMANGEILAFTDADCVAEPDWIENLISPFQDPMVGCVAGAIIPFNPINYIQTYWDKNILVSKIQNGDVMYGGNCAIRTMLFDQIGLFRDDLPSGGDTEILFRMLAKTNLKRTVAINAIVHHKNVGNLIQFFRQSIRYGSQSRLKINFSKENIPTWVKLSKLTIQLPLRTTKRILEVTFKSKTFPSGIQNKGFILKPFLDWLAYSGNLIGYKFPKTRFFR